MRRGQSLIADTGPELLLRIGVAAALGVSALIHI